jgi:hypothetical protein
MKKLIFSFLLILTGTLTTFSQENKVAHTNGAAALTESKTSGTYTFILPEGTSAETVAQNAKYYTHYFTVSFNETNHEATIQMVTNDEKSRHVICRFLIASEVSFVHINGEDKSVEEFYQSYLK